MHVERHEMVFLVRTLIVLGLALLGLVGGAFIGVGIMTAGVEDGFESFVAGVAGIVFGGPIGLVLGAIGGAIAASRFGRRDHLDPQVSGATDATG